MVNRRQTPPMNLILISRRYIAGKQAGAWMPVQRKIFRIEELFSNGESPELSGFDAGHEQRHTEIMTELRALRSTLSPVPQSGTADVTADAFKAQAEAFHVHIAEARKFKIELDVIDQAIKQTKSEIVSLQDHGLDGGQIARVNLELTAVVNGTTEATDRILKAAETIEQTAGMLGAALKNEHEQGLAQDIQDQVTQIFEACNFHDLTSQRISKVLITLNQVEEHIGQMIEIWSAIERFTNYVARLSPTDGASMLNGPKLDGDEGHASQNDIDSLFH